ncbi:hypothetical protein DUHN55_46460 [Helicobacter pylori]
MRETRSQTVSAYTTIGLSRWIRWGRKGWNDVITRQSNDQNLWMALGGVT